MKNQLPSYINQIMDFYNDTALSKGYHSPFFREGNPEDWIMSRLNRAVQNEDNDHLFHSRYAIWSSNVCDLIESSITAINKNDNAEAIKLLELATRTLMAYKDIQTVLDHENFYSINSVFKAYATHLLSFDDDKSVIIDKNEIIQILKRNSHVSGASLPRDLNISIKNSVLQIHVNNVSQNMQTDSAAFESWILILKTWLSGAIKYVELDFTVPTNVIRYGTPEACHYNRFLYRLNNMLRLFPSWFFINESKIGYVSEFMDWMKKGPCLLNHSLQERESVIQTEKMERQIESWFVFEQGKDLICNRWEIDKDKLFNQLPMGVFYQAIAQKNAIFTRGASAVDIWGVSKDGRDLHLIELKCGNNMGLGVISELLFYMAVVYDTCISENSLFTFGRYGNSADTKDMTAINNKGEKFRHLYGHILAEKYHPLFVSDVEALINEGLSGMEIQLDRATYDYSNKVII